MAWSSETQSYCGWNEVHVTNMKGRAEVHYYLERRDGGSDLAVIGRLKKSRRIFYGYALKKNRSIVNKLNSREDVFDLLNSIVSGEIPDVPATVMTEQAAGGLNIDSFMNVHLQEPAHPTRSFSWMGSSWTCRKGRKHYPSFFRNGVRVSVNDFVYVLAEQNKRLVAYLEDLYEDSKGNKMVLVRWFHKTDEVCIVLPGDVSDREIFFSLCLQDINIECIDGLATVLSPQHYEKLLKAPMQVDLVAFFCQKSYGDDGVESFDITQLQGYWRQEMLRYLNVSILQSGEGARAPGTDPGLGASLVGCNGFRSKKRRHCSGAEISKALSVDDKKGDCKGSPDSLNLGASDASISKSVTGGSSHHIKRGSLVEILSEDSGIRGCWFRALIIKKHKDKVKVQYQDIQDADDDSKKLEEWILTSRVGAADHLGLRIPGRKIVRPYPKPSKANTVWAVGVGMAVDVWWCDGWWEGIVVEKVSEEKFKVYMSGEKKMDVFHCSKLRHSLEWLVDEWVHIESRFDLLDSILSLLERNELEMKLNKKPSEVGLGSGGMATKVDAKLNNSLPLATSINASIKQPVRDLRKDVLVSDLKWKASRKRKRKQIVSCSPHDPSLTRGFSCEGSFKVDCENCNFMENSVFGSSVVQPLTGLLMSR